MLRHKIWTKCSDFLPVWQQKIVSENQFIMLYGSGSSLMCSLMEKYDILTLDISIGHFLKFLVEILES